jgi:ribosomal protein L29
MKFEEIKSMNPEDRQKKADEARIELMKLNSQIATGTNPKNPHQVRQLKKILAQIKTLEKTAKQ